MAASRPLDAADALTALSLFAAGFAIRAYNWRNVFVGGEVRFDEFDPFGHMRRVMLTLAHWPHVPQFDYFTNFPYGAKLAWGPGLDWLLATLSLVLGLGTPLEADVERWCAIAIPAIGALSVVCAWLLARELLGRGAAVLAGAIVAILPVHVFLGIVGRVDHHVTEPLFASLLWLFFLRAARTGRMRAAWAAGLAQALGVLFWPGAILFSALLLAALLVECAVAALRRRAESPAVAAGVHTLFAGALFCALAAPLSLWGREGAVVYVAVSWFQPIALAAFGALLVLARLVAARARAGLRPAVALAALLGAAAILGVGALLVPGLRATLEAGVGYLLTSDPIIRTISESKSPLEAFDFIQFFFLVSYWGLLLPFALIGLATDHATWEEGPRGPLQRFLLVVSLLGVALFLKQARHVAALTLLMPIALAAWLERLGLRIPSVRARSAAAVLLFVAVSAQPLWFYTFGRSYIYRVPPVTPLLEPLTWMRYNTPPVSEGIAGGDVPAYGVMGYFGMGMYLNYVARRPNVGTPLAQLPWHDEAIKETFRFQFAETEPEALRILERRRVRYVVTIPFYLFLKNGALILGRDPDRWIRDTRRFEEEKIPSRFDFRPLYFSLIDSRLLLLDGSAATIRGRAIPALSRFRLVHECPQALQRANFGGWAIELPPDLRYCKIYEVVPGARISGTAAPGARVALSLDVRAGLDRRFTYRSDARADASGRYAFTVPYSTDPGESDVRAEGPYRIVVADGRARTIQVAEAAVREGREVAVRP